MDLKRQSLSSNLNLDVVKFLVSAIGAGMVLFGYSYTHTFFRSFGLSLFQLDMSYIDIIYRGIALIVFHPWLSLPWICVSVILWVIAPRLSQTSYLSQLPRFSQFLSMVCSLLAVVFLIFFALNAGKYLGQNHAKQIWADGRGKKAFCRFHAEDSDPLSKLLPKLDDLAREGNLHVGSKLS